MDNAQFLAYPPVVAAGNNANVIHYINNTQIAKDGEMVLMDAGSFFQYQSTIYSIAYMDSIDSHNSTNDSPIKIDQIAFCNGSTFT